jgi:hypothetical protein
VRALRPARPEWLLAGIALAGAAIRFAAALQVPAPLYFPDTYIYSSLARSIAATGLPRIRGAFVSFVPVLVPYLTAPVWLIRNVDVAWRVGQAEACVAFSLAAFPAYALARRVGLSERGGVVVAVFTLLVPDGAFTSTLLTEPYAYPAFLLVVLLGVEAIAAPSPRRQAVFLVGAAALCLVRLQFAVVFPAYLVGSSLRGGMSPRRFLREQGLVLGAVVVVFAAAAAVGLGRVAGPVYRHSRAFHNFPVLELAKWFATAAFAVGVVAGWLIAAGAAVGLRGLFRASRSARAFAVLGVCVAVGLCLEAAAYAANGGGGFERYTFYLAPLAVIAFVASLELGPPRSRLYAGAAYAGAAAAILLPAAASLRSSTISQAPAFLGLTALSVVGGTPTLVWAPALAILAVLVAWLGAERPRAVLLGAAAVCIATSVGGSARFVRLARATPAPRAETGHSASLLTWAVADAYYLDHVLFWNPDVSRVAVVGGGAAPDGYRSVSARLTPRLGLADAAGVPLRPPYVLGPDVVANGSAAASGGPALVTLDRPPSVLAFGWLRQLGYLGEAGRLFAVAGRRPLRVTIRVWSPDGPKSLLFRCVGAAERTIDVPGRSGSSPDRKVPVVFVVPAEGSLVCRFSTIRGSVQAIGSYTVSVRAALTVAPTGA